MTSPVEPARSRLLGNVLIPVMLTLAVGIALCAANSNLPFANGGNCDPWYFFGRFFNADQLATLSQSRESSRLPLFIVGYIATRLFGGVSADYVNFFVLFVAAALAVYYATKRLFGLTAAVAATIFFTTNPQIVGNFSVDFSAPAVTFSALAMALAIAASTMQAGTKRVAALLAAGFFWGTAIHGHLFSLSFNFAVTLYCLDWKRRPVVSFLRDAIVRWVLLLIGAVLATVFFGLINLLILHGNFLFFMNQYNAIYTVNISDYEKPLWFFLGGRGALLLVGLGATVVQWVWVLRRGFGAPEVRAFLTALIPYTAIELMQAGYRLAGGLPLQYDYYFVFIMPSLALLIGSIVGRARLGRTLSVVALIVFLAGSLAGDFGGLDLAWQSTSTFPPNLAIAIVLAVVFIALLRFPRATVLASVVLLIGLNATIRPEKFGLFLWDGSGGRDAYARLRMGMAFISSHRFPVLPKFWINANGPLWETIAYPRSYMQCSVDIALPDFLKPSSPYYAAGTEVFSAGDYLVMIPRDVTDLSKAIERLHARGLTFKEMGRRNIASDGIDYLIVVGKLL